MALRRLLDQDAQRERRRQMILLDRLSATAERLIAREIASSTRDMVKKWEVTGQVPESAEHQRRVDVLLRRIWRASVEGMGKRINEAAKAKGKPSITKEQDKYDLYVEEYIAAYGLEKIEDISKTTIQQIKNQIDAGRREGLGQGEIAKRIQDTAPRLSRQRAAVIARTESHAAGNYGAMKQAEQTGLRLQKEWIASQGPRTRRISDGALFDHSAADGQVVPMNEPFTIPGKFRDEQLMYPGDPSGSAANVISCRCAVGYVVED